jgi:hypothetical protein
MTRAVHSLLGFSFCLSGCAIPTVDLQGVVTVGSPTSGEPAGGVYVSVLNGELEEIEQVVTSSEGLFRARAPSGETVHLVVTDEGGFSSSFRGISGMNPRSPVPVGYLHTFGAQSRSEWAARFTGCEGEGDGAMTVGQIRVDLWDANGEQPVAHAASVDVFDLNGDHLSEGCYLNDAGETVDLAAERVGESGMFGVFGLPAGRLILRVEAHLVESEPRLYEFDLYLPEAGAAPRFPILIPFEL